MKTKSKRSSNAPKRNVASKPIAKTKRPAYDRGNRIYIERVPETLYKRFLKAAKQNNGNKADTLRKAIDLYCDVQEGKATIRRKAK